MYDHTFYKQVQISRSDIRPHIKWAVSLVILHMITSIFLRALCGYIWVNIMRNSSVCVFGDTYANYILWTICAHVCELSGINRDIENPIVISTGG